MVRCEVMSLLMLLLYTKERYLGKLLLLCFYTMNDIDKTKKKKKSSISTTRLECHKMLNEDF